MRCRTVSYCAMMTAGVQIVGPKLSFVLDSLFCFIVYCFVLLASFTVLCTFSSPGTACRYMPVHPHHTLLRTLQCLNAAAHL